jgi:hypothetical protein
VSGATPFYCPVKLRFCVRSNSCIVVRFRPIFAQCSLVTAVREYIKSIPQEKREIQKFMKKFTKQGKKERMMLERWPRIRKAILEDKLSFRKLEIFLNEKYDMDVTQSYINKIWNKIEGDLKNGEKNS